MLHEEADKPLLDAWREARDEEGVGSSALKEVQDEDEHEHGNGNGNGNGKEADSAAAVVPRIAWGKVAVCFVAALAWLLVFTLPIMDEDKEDEQKTLALVVLVCILWATEAIPVWVTSLLIPLMIVLTRILLSSSGAKLSAVDSAKQELANLADPNVVLLMGGFTIAGALHKYDLDSRVALLILSHSGPNPRKFVFVVMVVGFVMSMFVNNVAAPVLCFFLVTPILHKIEDRAYCQCLVMSIAFACNIGGMPTPIASPQNAAALDAMNEECKDVGFTSWMLFALPITCPMLVVTWLWLQVYWKPTLQTLPALDARAQLQMDWRHAWVAFVTVFTIALWCTFKLTQSFFGSLGLIGLIPIVLLYAPGVLAAEDLRRLDWNILMLLGGGASLGDAVKSSHLLDTLADNVLKMFGEHNTSETHLFGQFMFFNVVVIMVANFISHTVAAITMMPVIAEVGSRLTPSKTVPYVIGSVLMDSGACALPVSSFPNVIAFGVPDAKGNQYLKTADFLKAAVVVELVATALVASVGWQMTKIVTGDTIAGCHDE